MSGPLTQKDRATFSRRAAALYRHWLRDDVDGVLELINETTDDQDSPDPVTSLVCCLLDVGQNLILAAREGQEIEYLDYVLAAASLDEVKEQTDDAT